MECNEAQDLLSTYHDKELAAELHADVKAHVNACPECSVELTAFEQLSSLASTLEIPETPSSVWSGIERSLAEDEACKARASLSGKYKDSSKFANRRVRIIAAVAATILVGVVGYSLWQNLGHDDHAEMAHAMEQLVDQMESTEATSLLLNKFGGKEVSFDDAVTEVGYRPIASNGLPEGYSIENVQALDMPCCRCLQTVCLRPDQSRLFIYEHDNGETGWFPDKTKIQTLCCGKTCDVVKLDTTVVVTWQKDNRFITLLGIRSDEEMELFVGHFEQAL